MKCDSRHCSFPGTTTPATCWVSLKNPCYLLPPQVGATPKEVVQQCDITFAMLSDPPAALEVAIGPEGVAAGAAGKPARHTLSLYKACLHV